MGMSASQARLLSITARLSDNESNGQALSYAKQRLADETEQINAEYNSALESTKLTVLTGFNGSSANYSDISYNLMTGYNTVSCGKQYVVTNQKGNVVVSDNLIKAYEAGNGDFNVFLNSLGYSQADFPASATDDDKTQQIHDAWDKYFASVGISHEDPDYDTVNFSFDVSGGSPVMTINKEKLATIPVCTISYNGEVYELTPQRNADGTLNMLNGSGEPYGWSVHNISIQSAEQYQEYLDSGRTDLGGTNSSGIYENPLGGYCNEEFTIGDPVEYNPPIFLEQKSPTYMFTDKTGTEHTVYYKPHFVASTNTLYSYDGQYKNDLLMDGRGYASALLDSYEEFSITNFDKITQVGELTEPVRKSTQTTYLNFEGCTAEQRELYDYAVALTLANSNASSNLATVTDDPENANIISYYRNIFNQMAQCGYEKVSDDTKTDSKYFEQQLKDGKLLLKSYSSTDKAFVSTSISEDEAIQEVEDNRLIALAEAKYTQDTQALERKDQKLDLEIKKLDTEHTALQTEYDSVKTVIDKNVETSFKCFG